MEDTMKRYFMEYESDRIVCQSNHHIFGFASSLKTAKGYIGRCRRTCADQHPRNFRVYDTLGEAPEGCHVPCVYSEN